jgi:hypothetical protein
MQQWTKLLMHIENSSLNIIRRQIQIIKKLKESLSKSIRLFKLFQIELIDRLMMTLFSMK